MRLLQFAITGCRDAAGHGELERCRHELEFSRAVRRAVVSSEIDYALQQAWNNFAAAASTEGDDVMKYRAEMYRSLIATVLSEETVSASVWEAAEFAPIVSTLDLGLSLLAQALSNADMIRAEIEADHIHNLPSHLIPGNTKSRNFYLDSERNYYLDRIKQLYGDKERDDVSQRFDAYWRAMIT